MNPLTAETHKDVFNIDDSLFDRSRSAKTELLAKVFDHCSMKYKRGFCMLILGWFHGNSFIPVNQCLFSAVDDKNLLCNVAALNICFPLKLMLGYKQFLQRLSVYETKATKKTG